MICQEMGLVLVPDLWWHVPLVRPDRFEADWAVLWRLGFCRGRQFLATIVFLFKVGISEAYLGDSRGGYLGWAGDTVWCTELYVYALAYAGVKNPLAR